MPIPAVSPTVWEPTVTCTAPVVPPSTTFAPVPAVALSICKLGCRYWPLTAHVSILSTYYCLRFIEPLAELASEAFATHWAL